MPDYSIVLNSYKSCLNDDPSCLEGWRRLAQAYELFLNFNESLPIWEKVVRFDPSSLDSRISLAIAQRNTSQYKQARESMAIAIGLYPESVAARFNQAWTMLRSGDIAQSVSEQATGKLLSKVVALAREGKCVSDLDYSLAAYASYISSYNDYDALIRKWKAAFPVSSRRSNSLGVRACDYNDFTSAECHFKEGVTANPFDLDVLRNLAELFVFKVDATCKEKYWLRRLREVEEWHFNPTRILHD